MIFDLTQREFKNVTGGLLAECLVTTLTIGTYRAYRTYQDGICVSAKDQLWCYAIECGQDAIFYGTLLTLVAKWFNQPNLPNHPHHE